MEPEIHSLVASYIVVRLAALAGFAYLVYRAIRRMESSLVPQEARSRHNGVGRR